MDNLLKLAIATGLSKDIKEFRAKPGTHEIDQVVTLRIKGQVKKGEDSEYTPTVEIPLLPTLALLLEKSGFQRELSKRLLIEAMTEALQWGDKASEDVEDKVKDIEAAMSHVREITGNLPKKTKSGQTNVKVCIEEVPALVVEQIGI